MVDWLFTNDKITFKNFHKLFSWKLPLALFGRLGATKVGETTFAVKIFSKMLGDSWVDNIEQIYSLALKCSKAAYKFVRDG